MTKNRTQLLFRDETYLTESSALIVDINSIGDVVLDRTIFYPTGGGQPGDHGKIVFRDSIEINIVATGWSDYDKSIACHTHVDTTGEIGLVQVTKIEKKVDKISGSGSSLIKRCLFVGHCRVQNRI